MPTTDFLSGHRLWPKRWRAALACAGLALLLAMPAGPVGATSVNVVGLFPGKALVSINGGAPRTLAPGQKTPEGVVLVATSGDGATLDIDGQRRSLRLGEPYSAQAGSSASGSDSVVLTADGRGHYNTIGAVNGRSASFVVDTGATMVWMSSELATRLNVPWLQGRKFTVQTAGGSKTAYGIELESVRVGNLTLNKVEAAVGEGEGTGDTALLGMSFLSRLNMSRDGNHLILSRKEGSAPAGKDTRPQLTLLESSHGMFATNVTINGATLPFVIDTGATRVSIDAAMAQRLGLNYQNGTPATVFTANGPVHAWLIKFDSVSIGPITLYGVDGVVRESGEMGIGLLGMSFLNRVEMHREGEAMTLIKRF